MSLRRKLLCRLRDVPYYDRESFKQVGKGTTISYSGYFEVAENIEIGDGCYIGPGSFWSGLGGITIGNNVIVGPRTCLYTQNHNWNSTTSLPFGPPAEDLNLPIAVKDNVWICLGAHILPGVTVGEGAIIGMGAVVAKDVPPLSVVVGNPAVCVAKRDDAIYYDLRGRRQYVGKFDK